MKRQRDRDRLSRSLQKLKQKRGSMDLVEKGARLAGSVGGFVLGTVTTGVGGAAGAAAGNAAAGGLFDVIDKSQEAQLKDVGFHSELGDIQWQEEVADIDAWTSQQDKMANTRHIIAPAKAFMTGMKVAEAGTVASAAGSGATDAATTEAGTKVVEEGGAEIVKEGVKKAGEEASQNAIKTATKEGVKKSWDQMTYLEKATHNPFAGKSLEENFGTIKTSIENSKLGQIMKLGNKKPEVIAKTGLDTAVNSEAVVDPKLPVNQSLLDSLGIKGDYDVGNLVTAANKKNAYTNIDPSIKTTGKEYLDELLNLDVDKKIPDHPFPIPQDQLEKIKANADLIQLPEGRDVPLPPGGVDKGNFFTRLKENYRQKQLEKDVQGSKAMWNERKEEIWGKKKQPKVTVGDPMGPKTYGDTGLIDPYWDPSVPKNYVQDKGGNWVPPEILAGRKGKLSGIGRISLDDFPDTSTVIPKQSMSDMLNNPNMTNEDIFNSMGIPYNKSGGNSITDKVEVLDTSMSIPSVDNIVKDTEVVNNQIKSSTGTNEERFSDIMDAMKIQEGGSPDSITAELTRPLPGGGYDTAKGTYQMRDIWTEEYYKLFPGDKDLDLKHNEEHQRKALGKWLEYMIDEKGYTKEQAVAAYNAGETGMKQGFGDTYADSVFTHVQDTTLGDQNVFEPPMMDEVIVRPDNVVNRMDENTRTAYEQLLEADKDQVWPYQSPGDPNNIPFLKEQEDIDLDPLARFNRSYFGNK